MTINTITNPLATQSLNIQPKSLYVSHESFCQSAIKVGKLILDWKFDHIVCITRGGAPLGDALSRLFKKPLATMAMSSYRGPEGKDKKELIVAEHISSVHELTGNVLLVDDLADSGDSLIAGEEQIRKQYPNVTEIKTAVLFYKSYSSKVKPDYFADDIKENTWIDFYYEDFEKMSLKTAM